MSDGATDTLLRGAVLEGRYEILSEIGKGGYGVVYKARQRSTGQQVAVKVLLEEHFSSSEHAPLLRARFEREMNMIAQLKHPNIVRLIDSGHLEDGRLFTVLEYIEGDNLADVIDTEGRLGVREARRLMMQVLDALSSAHAQGIIHRDLKPENIMLATTGYRRNAMVLDFGIAALQEKSRGDDYIRLTRSGHFQGTPSYMAPEQLRDEPVTPQTDIFAWGLVFLECLTGQIVVQAETVAEIIYLMLSSREIPIPSPLREHPLGRVLRRAVAKSLSKRFASVPELIAEFEAYELATSLELPVSGLENLSYDLASDARQGTGAERDPDTVSGDTVLSQDAEDEATGSGRDTRPSLPGVVDGTAPSPDELNAFSAAALGMDDEEEEEEGAESTMTIVERRPSWVTLLESPLPENAEGDPEDRTVLLTGKSPGLLSTQAEADGSIPESRPTRPFDAVDLARLKASRASRAGSDPTEAIRPGSGLEPRAILILGSVSLVILILLILLIAL